MTPEQRRDERDAEMLAKVKQGWWVQCRWSEDRWPTPGTRPWVILLTPCSSDGRLLVWADSNTFLGGSPVVIPVESVTALHRPTDNPQMETAYKLHEPPTVTPHRGGLMVRTEWRYQHINGCWRPVRSDGMRTETMRTCVTAIRSPGGNVYEIEEEANDGQG